ncbi:hypothetical protein CDD83_781 [Cordyceps sp. RAO-2017]|nr:hypothetical protein CDD83_781 [Cordyceps sp. RAO-2017]
MIKSAIALSAAFAAGVDAFWRMECPGRIGLARLDPIVNPGDVSNHVHSIHGSSGFYDNSSCSDLMAGDCTSCRVKQDKSSYWHPAVYFKNTDTGKIELVEQVGGMLAYYLLYGDDIVAFPDGFRMLSGNTERRKYTLGDATKPDPDKSTWGSLGQTSQEDLAQRAIGFNCLNYDRDPEPTLYRHYLPDKSFLDQNCKNGLRFEIMFPSCWKGGNAIDSPNHMDHVAFPDLVMNGACPKSHPHRLPSLMYEVIWNTNQFKGKNGHFMLSNGDTTGYGYHGDFITGWDEAFLQKAVKTCTNQSGRIEDCPLFDILSESEVSNCAMQAPLPQALHKENVEGPMMKLPGNGESGHKGDKGDKGGKGLYPLPIPVPAPAKEPVKEPVEEPVKEPVEEQEPSTPDYPIVGQIFKETSSLAAERPAPTHLASAALDAAAKVAPEEKPTTSAAAT